MIKTNIKMRVTPEQSAKVQEICFESGIYWRVEKEIKYLNEPFLFVDEQISFMYEDEEEEFLEEENEEVDADLFIRTNGTCIEEKEFTYPMWFKSRSSGCVVMFESLKKGTVVIESEGFNPKGVYPAWEPHTNTKVWEQVENPDLVIDIDNNKAKNPNSKHYELWENFEAIDVIKLALTDEEYKGFLKGNILKYRLRVGKKDDVSKEIEKIKDYERELNK